MKLNCDCVRDILLLFEKKTEPSDESHKRFLTLSDFSTSLENYSKSEIISAIESLSIANYLKCNLLYGEGQIVSAVVTSITVEGYDFLEIIRPKTAWEKFKSVISRSDASTFKKIVDIIMELI